MQMRHSLPRERSHALRQNHGQTLDDAAILLCEAAGVQPKNAAGQRAIDSRLRLLVVDTNNRKRALTLAKQSSQIGWTKRPLQIDPCCEPDDSPLWKISFERAPETGFVRNASGTPRRQ
jgi:hypothetical protein